MKTLISILMVFGVSQLSRAGQLVMDNKVYDLLEQKKEVCGEVDGPEFLAAKVNFRLAQELGIHSAQAVCKVDPRSKQCDPKMQQQMGLDVLFATVRKYPSTFSSEACKQLRLECQNLCQAANVLEAQGCLIECNQYETYNR